MAPVAALPTTTRALLLDRYIEHPTDSIRCLRLVERPVSSPKSGQVIVRMEAAPCNPSDLMFLQGRYGVVKTLPTVPGFEGSGVVIASGGGLMANWLVGQRVACGGQADADGTWSEYFCTDAKMCIPLQKGVDLEQGAMMIVNPLTALALFESCQPHRAAVHTAGASQLGRMLLRLAKDAGYPLIHLVRRDEQKQELLKLGAQYVLDTSNPEFETQYQQECARLGATLLIDAIAGPVGKLLKLMPDGSSASVYGGLSQQSCGEIDPLDLIFRQQSVKGFWLTPWLMNKSLLGKLLTTNRAQKLITSGVFSSQVRARLRLEDAVSGLLDYQQRMSEGKVLICPQLR